jgi:hypothetical protein
MLFYIRHINYKYEHRLNICGSTGFWWENLRKRDHLGDQGVVGRIILRWVFRKWDVEVGTGSSWLIIGTGGGHL